MFLDNRAMRPFLGIFVILVGIFMLLAFIDYDPTKSIMQTTKAYDYWNTDSNRLGYLGINLAFYTFRFFGYVAIYLPIYFLWIGFLYLFGYGIKFYMKKAIYAIIFIIFACTFFAFLEKAKFLSPAYSIFSAGAGGLFGLNLFSVFFQKYLGPIGSFIILLPMFIIFGMLSFASPSRVVLWIKGVVASMLYGSKKITESGASGLKSTIESAKTAKDGVFVKLMKLIKANKAKKKIILEIDKFEKESNGGRDKFSQFVDIDEVVATKQDIVVHEEDDKFDFNSLVKEKECIDLPKKNDSTNSNKIKVIESEVLEKASANVAKKSENYVFPEISLLQSPPPKLNSGSTEDYYETADDLVKKLAEFGVEVKVEAIQSGPVITRYEVTPAKGVRVEKITNLEKNIALGLKALSVRIQAPVPGKGCVGIEIPNKDPLPVCLREILESKAWENSNAEIPIVLGKEVTGKPIVADLTKMPHLLIAGSTGSGKTVCINAVIASLLYHGSPKDIRFIMVDPKIVEMKIYNDLPHMLIPVVTDPKKVPSALKWLIGEMERRYQLFADHGARNISSFNEKVKKLGEGNSPDFVHLPYIVCIIDELADLMMVAPGDIETCIARLAQLARAAGIHLIIATQRPSVNVITGIIKANLPSRIAFKVASKVDSRTILDSGGADSLIGKGDMLFVPPGASQLIRAQGALVSDDEINSIVDFLTQNGPPDFAEDVQKIVEADDDDDTAFDDNELEDSLIPKALEVLRSSDRVSTSLLQRRLKIGYNRAARIMEALEAKGLVPKNEE